MGSLLRAQWDRVTAWVAAALGALLLLIGYVKVSGTAFPAEQVPYLVSAGLGSLFLLGIAGSLWISADLRDEYAKLDEIARALAASDAREAAAAVAPRPVAPLDAAAADAGAAEATSSAPAARRTSRASRSGADAAARTPARSRG